VSRIEIVNLRVYQRIVNEDVDGCERMKTQKEIRDKITELKHFRNLYVKAGKHIDAFQSNSEIDTLIWVLE